MWGKGRQKGRHNGGPVRRARSARAYAMLFTLALLPGGCFGETFQRGYVLPDGALEQIPLGASQEQVLLVLGTPSTVATVSGEAFYYISQKAQRPISFINTEITDQRVVVVYFDQNRKVQRLAEYGMKDGKVFDFVSRTTPTSGAENNIITYMFRTISGKGS
jgi:outer membrane protein assembly factor BamE (lipoprotein component of BamABCDE complex)